MEMWWYLSSVDNKESREIKNPLNFEGIFYYNYTTFMLLVEL